MVPIPVFWTEYTATAQGRRLKFVNCEHCTTEYVYLIEREAMGAGNSMYLLNEEGAASQATSAAGEMLTAVLENDFDPIPCPECGHYQRFMFPKLVGNRGAGVRLSMLIVAAIGCLAAVTAVHHSVTYLQFRHEHQFGKMVTAWLVLPPLVLVAFGLSYLNRVIIRRFNPNAADQEARLAIGRNRAVTRAQFDLFQQYGKPSG